MRENRRINLVFWSKFLLILVAFAFFFTIKSVNYDRYPLMGHLEEYAYSWMGIHLIESGIPRTWSPAGKFPIQDNVFSGKIVGYDIELNVDILSPWLDLPPLYGLLSGGVAHFYGANPWSILPASYIRLPALFFAFATTIVLFLLTKKLFGFWPAILATTIYSLTPLFVFGQRLSVAENGITFFYILAIYLTILYLEKQKWYFLSFLPIVIGLAGLMKQTGFLIVFFIIFLLAKNKLWKEIAFVLLGVSWFVGVLLAYGAAVDWNLFVQINLQQSGRPVGFLGLPFLLSSPGYSINFFYDGWYIFSLFAAVYLAITKFADKRFQLVSLAFIFWAMVVVFSGGQTDVLLWYHFPFFPFLSISAALLLFEIIRQPNLVTTILVIGLLLSGRSFLSNEFKPQIEPAKFRFIITMLVSPAIFYFLLKKTVFLRITKIVLVSVIVVGFFLNTQAIYSAFPIASESKSFPYGPGTFLSGAYLPFFWRFLLIQ
ncbi:glycosyltransferase family 39 protein [Candidatus Daviesbacteria bacterium]|nr:glycosyltransferase family 39 protein [Candidatus Daviesbacteria bacterium]